ncbi:MAG TPA: CARDB domain-containing protein [Patescibacteria group bacterium]|nr:CARDB domain-containing protein [Patescibacteria group bacterium]
MRGVIGLTRDGRFDAGRIWSRLLLIAALMLVAWSQPKLVEAEFALTQLTATTEGGSRHPSMTADGTRIAFASSDDLVPDGNPDGNREIFLWTQGTGFTQLTNTTGGHAYRPAISADGTRIAFYATSNPTDGNPDGNGEIFLWTSPSTITQLTTTTGGGNSTPSINADGTRIAFYSDRNVVPDGNPDGNFEIFLWTGGDGFTQITTSTGGNNFTPSISADGTRIAFYSNRNLTGENADVNQEIFLWTASNGFTQLTDTAVKTNFAPSISADGTRIAFLSANDLVPGGNKDENFELFLWTDGTGFTQLTDTTEGSSGPPFIAPDGTRIAFISDHDLIPGGNTDENEELFLWTDGTGFTQLTDTTEGDDWDASITAIANGTRIAVASVRDLVPGGNADGNSEIFLLQEYHTLTITLAGTGAGTVTASGIICPGDCTKAYPAGTAVTLSATAAPGSVFSGFSGDPDCTDGALTLQAETHCIATFAPASGPDLTGTWSLASQSWSKGRYTLRSAVRVVNQGTTTASASRLRIFLSDDAVLDSGDALLKDSKIKKRKPGQGKTKELKVKLSVGESAAGKYLFAVVDALHSVTETNETNNTPMTGPIP